MKARRLLARLFSIIRGQNACVALIALFTCTALNSTSDIPHGMGILYVRPTSAPVRSLQARLTLGQRTDNKSWYACWLMLLPYGDQTSEAFVQVGIMRWPGSGPYAWPFIAVRKSGASLVFKAFRPTKEWSGHVFFITIADSHVEMSTRNRIFFKSEIAPYFNAKEPLYFQIGNELSAYNDSISAYESDIMLDEGKSAQPYVPDCEYTDDDLHMRYHRGAWKAWGIFLKSDKKQFSAPLTGSVIQSCR